MTHECTFKPFTDETGAKFQFLFKSGCEWALNRKTSRTDRTLVCIFSQNIFVIYDEKTEKIEEIKTYIKFKNFLPQFLNDKKRIFYYLDIDFVPIEKRIGLSNQDIEKIFHYFKYHSTNVRQMEKEDWFEYLYKHNTITLTDCSYSVNFSKYFSLSPSLLLKAMKLFSNETYYRLSNSLEIVFALYTNFGMDVCNYFLEKINVSGFIYNLPFQGKELIASLKEYNVDPTCFIDYFFEQSINCTFDAQNYLDYLDMCFEYYKSIPNKYPKSILTEHDKIAAKLREKTILSTISFSFEETMENSEDFTYQNPKDNYCIVMPKVATDLINEGQLLGHCVGSYVEKVVNGDCLVVFMRNKKDNKTPLLTIEILQNRTVSQVEGYLKRTNLSEKERVFIQHWMDTKKLTSDLPILAKL